MIVPPRPTTACKSSASRRGAVAFAAASVQPSVAARQARSSAVAAGNVARHHHGVDVRCVDRHERGLCGGGGVERSARMLLQAVVETALPVLACTALRLHCARPVGRAWATGGVRPEAQRDLGGSWPPLQELRREEMRWCCATVITRPSNSEHSLSRCAATSG